MEDKTNAFWYKAEVSGLTPDEEVESDVEEFSSVIVGVLIIIIYFTYIGFLVEEGAPGGVVFEEVAAEGAEDGGGEGVEGGRRGGEAELGVGEVEDEVFALVEDVVGLEAEEGGEPVEEVHVVVPLDEWGFTEVTNGA